MKSIASIPKLQFIYCSQKAVHKIRALSPSSGTPASLLQLFKDSG
jgi:hypothetical protein